MLDFIVITFEFHKHELFTKTKKLIIKLMFFICFYEKVNF